MGDQPKEKQQSNKSCSGRNIGGGSKVDSNGNGNGSSSGYNNNNGGGRRVMGRRVWGRCQAAGRQRKWE
jgi:hypothetical protein